MTKDEFKKALWAYGQERHCLGGEMSFEQRGIAVKSAGAIRKALLDTYDEMTERIAELEAALDAAIKDRDWHSEQLDRRSVRIAELEGERDAARAEAQARLESYNAEVDEFSAGFDAYRAGLSLYDQPEVIYDVWRVGYAWAAYNAQVKRIKALEAMLKRVQWAHDLGSTYTGEGQCPICRGWQWEGEGHAPDCALAALLGGER